MGAWLRVVVVAAARARFEESQVERGSVISGKLKLRADEAVCPIMPGVIWQVEVHNVAEAAECVHGLTATLLGQTIRLPDLTSDPHI